VADAFLLEKDEYIDLYWQGGSAGVKAQTAAEACASTASAAVALRRLAVANPKAYEALTGLIDIADIAMKANTPAFGARP
jgi:hypothetical protein